MNSNYYLNVPANFIPIEVARVCVKYQEQGYNRVIVFVCHLLEKAESPAPEQ